MEAADAFRENIRAELAQRGLSISALARLAGTQQSTMSRILAGSEAVTLQRADRIAHALELTLADLLHAPVGAGDKAA